MAMDASDDQIRAFCETMGEVGCCPGSHPWQLMHWLPPWQQAESVAGTELLCITNSCALLLCIANCCHLTAQHAAPPAAVFPHVTHGCALQLWVSQRLSAALPWGRGQVSLMRVASFREKRLFLCQSYYVLK
jgi:hypothetical protein